MEEVTDISPMKANSTNMSRSMHTVSLKVPSFLSRCLEMRSCCHTNTYQGSPRHLSSCSTTESPEQHIFRVTPNFFSHETRKEQVRVYARWWKWFFPGLISGYLKFNRSV